MSPAKEPTEKGVWYLADVPIGQGEQDAFGHADVANNLLTMLREPRRGRLMVGLFGSFGVGKSSVIELLRSSLAGDKDQVLIRVSAERHEIENFHRSFVFSTAERLIEQGLANRNDVQREMDSLEYASTKTQSDLTLSPIFRLLRRLAIATTKSAARLAVMVFVLAAVFLGIVTIILATAGVFGVNTASAVASWIGAVAGLLSLAISVPLVGSVFAGLRKMIAGTEPTKPGLRSATRPRAEAADEYERTFARLVDLVGPRLVIAVDDVDRMAASDILSALNAIRTFQLTAKAEKRPAFIVSVDERVVATAIASDNQLPVAGGDGSQIVDDYLNRLFTQRQQMPPHVPGDLRTFARELLSTNPHEGAQKLEDKVESVLNVLIHDGVKDPRHVIRLLNSFFGDYRLAYRREQQIDGRRSISEALVTANPVVLARMTVFRVDFPSFHEILSTDTRILDAVEGLVRGDTSEFDEEDFHDRLGLAADSEGFSRLKRFVGRTATWAGGVDDILPFIYLGQSKFERSVGSKEARLAKSLLANRQVSELGSLLEKSTRSSADRREAILDFLVEATRTLEGFELNNAVEALVANADAVLELDTSLAAAIGDALYRAQGSSPDVDGLITLLSGMENDLQRTQVARALVGPVHSDLPAWTESLMTRRHELTDEPIVSVEVAKFLRLTVHELQGAETVAEVERFLTRAALPDNSDLAEPLLVALFLVSKKADEDLSEAGSKAAIELASLLPKESLSGEFKSALQSVLVENLPSVTGATASQAIEAAEVSDSQQIADLAYSFLRGAMDIGAGTIKPGIKHEQLEAGEYLLRMLYSKANTYTINKRRVDSHASSLLASAVANWSTSYPVVNRLALEASVVHPKDLTELAKAISEVWASKTEALDSDEIGLVLVLFRGLDLLDAAAEPGLKEALEAGLQPSAASDVRAAAITLLPDLMKSARGRSWTGGLLEAVATSYSNSRPMMEASIQSTLALSATGAGTADSAAAIIGALRSRVIPYGLVAEALQVLVRYPWPPANADEALALIESHLGSLTDELMVEFFAHLGVYAKSPISPPTLELMTREGVRLFTGALVTSNVVTNLLPFLAPADALGFVLELGAGVVEGFRQFMSDQPAKRKIALSQQAPAVLISRARVDDWARQVMSLLSQLEPGHFADAVEDVVVGQLSGLDELSSAAARALIPNLGPSSRHRIEAEVKLALARSANEVSLSLPILEVIEIDATFDAAMAEIGAEAIRYWSRDVKNEAVSVRLARVLAKGAASKKAVSAAIGPRGPRSEPGRSIYRAIRREIG